MATAGNGVRAGGCDRRSAGTCDFGGHTVGATAPKNLNSDSGWVACRAAAHRARSKVRGLVLGAGFAGRRFEIGTLALAEDLATRAAVSLDNCLLYAKIQDGDQRKNEFLAMLAHELRNPLAPIRNAVQLLQAPDCGQTKLDWALNVLDRQTRQLVRLVDDLLDVARITQGRILLKLEPVDVAKVVDVAVERADRSSSARAWLAITVPAVPLAVHGDYSRVAQILANLLNNAAKYTEPKGRISRVEEDGADVVFRVR